MHLYRSTRKDSPFSRHFLKAMVHLSVIRIFNLSHLRLRSASEISIAGLVGSRFLLDSSLHVADAVTEAPLRLAAASQGNMQLPQLQCRQRMEAYLQKSVLARSCTCITRRPRNPAGNCSYSDVQLQVNLKASNVQAACTLLKLAKVASQKSCSEFSASPKGCATWEPSS
jgi:hypothetical protein